MIVILWRAALFLLICALGWVGWALWWPVAPPLVVHDSHAEPATVRAGQLVAMVADAEFRRDLAMTVTPRLEGPGGVLYLPATDQHWRAGRYHVRRVIQVPPLAAGRYTYTPTFRFRLTPLRDGYAEGVPAPFEVTP